ncbi:hypothetical protein [Mycoplasma sp. 4404]|uniref:coiled-coil domain-containing protein n=1 Tax=Mycoplasma sp. 4404 TaxID=3108530 RepID=UPI002B1DCD83|nr:hypothetical protein [Mycoplasma sp. 4404]MEA4162653.1 hypothetical protein [Mycoplasma sp. 4404]
MKARLKSLVLGLSGAALLSPMLLVSCNNSSSSQKSQAELKAEKAKLNTDIQAEFNKYSSVAKSGDSLDQLVSKKQNELFALIAELDKKEVLSDSDVKKLADFLQTLKDQAADVLLRGFVDKNLEVVAIEKQLEAAKKELEDLKADTEGANKETLAEKEREIQALNDQLEIVKNELEDVKSKMVKRAPSGKQSLLKITKAILFYLSSFKSKYPELYKSNQSIIDGAVSTWEKSSKEYEAQEDDYNNINYFYAQTMYALNWYTIIKNYFPEAKVEMPFPKEEFMNSLFQWRIKDLENVAVNLSSMDRSTLSAEESAKVDENIQLVNGVKTNYEEALNTSTNLDEQFINFQALEIQFWSKYIYNTNSFNEYKPSLMVPSLRISKFPLSNEIIDVEVLEQLKPVSKEIADKFSEFYKNTGFKYLPSVYYTNLYNQFRDDLFNVIRYQFIPKQTTLEGLLYVLSKSENDLSKYNIDTTQILADINAKANEMYDGAYNGSTYALYNRKVKAKWNEQMYDGDENSAIYKSYKKFNTWAVKQMSEIKALSQEQFVSAVDRYMLIKAFDFKLNTLVNLFEYWKLQGIDPKSEEMEAVLQLSKSASKYQARIKTAEDTIADLEAIKAKLKELVSSYNLDTINHPGYTTIEQYSSTLNEDKAKVQAVIDTYSALTGTDGMFEFTFSEITDFFNSAVDNFRTIINKWDQFVADSNTEGFAETYKVLADFKSVLEQKVGDENDGNMDMLYVKFADIYQDNRSGDKYTNGLALLDEYTAFANSLKHGEFANETDARAYLNEKYSQFEQLNAKMTAAREEGGVFYALDDYQGFTSELDYEWGEFATTFRDHAYDSMSLDDLNSKVASLNEKAVEYSANFGKLPAAGETFMKLIAGDIETENSNIENFRRQDKKAKQSLYIVPGQEIYAFIRQMYKSVSAELSETSISEDHQDKVVYDATHKAIDNLVKKDLTFRNIIFANADGFEYLTDEQEASGKPKSELYTEMMNLESAYYQANLAYLKADDSSKNEKKEQLQQARVAYYNFLNSDNFSISRSSYLKFNLNVYKTYDDDSEFTPFDLALLFAQYDGSIELLRFVENTYIKNNQ